MRRLGLLASAGCVLLGTSLVLAAIPSNTQTTFEESVPLPAGTASTAVVVADVDLDGHLDLVVANNDSDDVSISYGNGDGTFDSPEFFTTRTGPSAVAVADMTGDGLPDIVVAHEASSEVLTLIQGPFLRSFVAGEATETDDGPTDVVVADFNGDGVRDAVTANLFSFDGTVSYLRGFGDGNFAGATNYLTAPLGSEDFFTGPVALAAADLDRDGNLDLVVANSDGNNIAFLRGNGDGTFAAPVNFEVGSAPVAISVADMNIDGRLDVVTADEEDWTVSLLIGLGDGTFEPFATTEVSPYPAGLSIWDFNLDGRPDVAVSGSIDEDDGVSILRGMGDGSFEPLESFPIQGIAPVSVTQGDLDGDFRPDVVTANLDADDEDRALSVLFNSSLLVPGDANTDGEVTEADIEQVLKEVFDGDGSIVIQVAGGVLASGPGADGNGDTIVSVADVLAITAIIASEDI